VREVKVESYFCDECSSPVVAGESGVVGTGEIVLEGEKAKISIALEISTFLHKDPRPATSPVICFDCLRKAVIQTGLRTKYYSEK